MWIILGLLALLFTPIIVGFIKDIFGLNSNKFYGDEMNKQKRTQRDKAYEKSAPYTNTVNQHHHGSHHHHDGGHQ